MDLAIQREEMADLYEEVRLFLYQQAHWAARHYRMSFEDALADVHLGFQRAYHDYTPDKGKFITYVGHKVYWTLRNLRREEGIRANLVKWSSLPEHAAARPSPEPFRLEEFASDLSEDAEEVLKVVLQSPVEFLQILRKKSPVGQPTRTNMFRAAVREFLMGLGWSSARVTESFKEIKEALG